MASIIKNDQQVLALESINEALESVQRMNALLTPDKEGIYQITFTPEKGRALRHDLTSEVEISAALSIVAKQRQKLIKETIAKAAKFRIDLDERDMAIMKEISFESSNTEPKEKGKTNQKEKEPPQEQEEGKVSLFTKKKP